MGTLLILITIGLAVWICWRWFGRRMLVRYAQRKTEDFVRSAFGMPPRDKTKKGNGRKEQRSSQQESTFRGRDPFRRNDNEPIIPKEYAEDVEYVEVKEFSQTTIGEETTANSGETYHEEQVTDVEWEEVRVKK